MESYFGKRFIYLLFWVGSFWLGLGVVYHLLNGLEITPFVEVFTFSALDLIFLILIFWKLFFTPPTQRNKKIQFLIFILFKLVCLGFLAIVLKRLRNAPTPSIILGVAFIGIGPIIAGTISNSFPKISTKE